MAETREIIVQRPNLKPYQLSAFFHYKRYAWIEGTTKCGKTYTGIVWLFEEAVTGAYKNYWWVAPTYKTAKIAYTRMADSIPKALRKLNETDLTITLPNGHIIWFLSAEKPDNLYGEDVGAVVIDEASRMREAAWWAIRTTVTKTRGKVRGIGNIKGKKNWFFRMARNAEAGEKDSHWAAITSVDAVREGLLSQEEIDDAQRNLPQAVFNELYMGIPTDDGSNPFGMKFIAAVSVLEGPTGRDSIAHGLDVARAVDWTVLLGLDSAGAVSLFERFQKPWEEFYTEILGGTDRSAAVTLADSTGLGDPVLSRLQKERPRRFEGYKFTRESKQRLMEGLAVAIQKAEVQIPKDGPLRMELENFEYEYTGKDGHSTGVRYSAPDGFHDDCVMALALAVAARGKRAEREDSVIYPTWGASNELKAVPDWHAERWDAGMVRIASLLKPHDRLPWAMLWCAIYPNEDVIAFQEWPPFDYESAKASPVNDVEGYRAAILQAEKNIGREVNVRIIHPEFAIQVKGGPRSMRQVLSGPCRRCIYAATHTDYDDVDERSEAYAKAGEKCKHKLSYSAAPDQDSVALVRAAIGDAAHDVRPRLYAMSEATPNLCTGLSQYAWRENKRPDQGTSDKAQKVYATFPELLGLGYLKSIQKWPVETPPPPMPVKRQMFKSRFRPK